MKKSKSHLSWSWIFMVIFILLSIIDFRFGLLGVFCIGTPIYHALRGRGKIHCSKYCPRGSLLGKFLQSISLENNLPKSFKTRTVKNILMFLMLTMFSISTIHAFGKPDFFKALGFGIFRLMTASLALGIIMGIVFKPRSWCQVCPMGHGTALIKEAQDKKKRDLEGVQQSSTKKVA